MKRIQVACICTLFSIACPAAIASGDTATPARPPADDSSVERLVKTLESMAFFGPQTMPTAPRPVENLVPEWHPAAAIIISVQSLPGVLGPDPIYRQYAGLIAHIVPMLNVMVLYPEKEQTLLGELIGRLENEPGIRPYSERLLFFPVAGPTMWIRDIGPQFGRESDGRLTVFDFAARPFMDEAEAWFTIPAELPGVEWEKEVEAFEANRKRERLADATPVGLVRHLRLKTGLDLPLSRPPISLEGGDFIFDGRGNVFISQETLLANGGDQDTLAATFREHVGPVKLHFLFPLPGNTTKHLDMVLKFVDPETVLVAAPPPLDDRPLSPYQRRLRFEIEAVLTYNRQYLASQFPGLKIIEVPILPTVDESPARILNRLRWRILARVCEINGLDVLDLIRRGTPPDRVQETRKRIFEAISRDLGETLELETLEELQTAALHYLRVDINTVIETNVPFQTIYRSPVNSVHLVDALGREKFLLPRFHPREGEDPEALKQLHKLAERAFRSARPGVPVEWVDADVAADLLGGLHCMMIALPAPE